MSATGTALPAVALKRKLKSIKSSNFFSRSPETIYDRELEQSFFHQFYREICLFVMGACLFVFGLLLTLVAIAQSIEHLFILGPAPMVLGIILLILATGFSIRRFLDRPRVGMGIHFVEAPDKLFLKNTNAEERKPPPKKDGGPPKSCLRRPSAASLCLPIRGTVDDSVLASTVERTRKNSYTEFPPSPMFTVPEVGGYDAGSSNGSTPEPTERTASDSSTPERLHNDDLVRRTLFMQPPSPTPNLPKVGGHAGESVISSNRSTPERADRGKMDDVELIVNPSSLTKFAWHHENTGMSNVQIADDTYPSEASLLDVTQLDIIPMSTYTDPESSAEFVS